MAQDKSLRGGQKSSRGGQSISRGGSCPPTSHAYASTSPPGLTFVRARQRPTDDKPIILVDRCYRASLIIANFELAYRPIFKRSNIGW